MELTFRKNLRISESKKSYSQKVTLGRAHGVVTGETSPIVSRKIRKLYKTGKLETWKSPEFPKLNRFSKVDICTSMRRHT